MKKWILSVLSFVLCLSSYAQNSVDLSGKALFGDLRARHIGPALMSGRIIDLELHPTSSRIMYAGTAGGGVWKSMNGGATFQPIFDKNIQSIGAVAIDPTDPDKTVWVGTGEIWTRNSVSVGDGLYKTSDGGLNWTKMGFEDSERISAIKVHPKNGNVIYVGVMGPLWSDGQTRGVYKTTDGGQTWEKILFIDETTGCADLVMDPVNPDILYASMWEFRRTPWSFSSGGKKSALMKSTDGGKTWNKIHNGFPEGALGRIAVAVAPSHPERLYAVLETEQDEDKGLYRSDDSGKSWNHMNSDFGLVVRPFYFSRITVDPQNPDILVKAGVFGSISKDGGETFRNLGSMHPDIHDIVFDSKDSDRMYVGTDGGVYRSWDGGTTLEIVENLPLSQFYHVSVDQDEPYNVYGGLQDNGSWYGPSSSPGGVEARDWNRVGQGDGFRVLRHPTKPIIYSEMQGAENVWRYDMEKHVTTTIQPLPEEGDPKLRFNWNAPMATSRFVPDRLYIGSQFLHRSDDMGRTWKKISPDLTTNNPDKQNQSESGGLSVDNSGAENHTTVFTIAESPIDQNIIWVGTDDGNVQVTQDDGNTWLNVTDNIPDLPSNTWCYHIEASVHNKGTAYAVFDGHTTGDMNTYVFKTTDFGQSWESISTDQVKGFARNIQEDYVRENLLFLGTEQGLYITINGGKNWSQFTNNMPPVAVHYIDLHEKTSDLVLGTHGRGVIIIDDISILREITQEILSENVYFFPPKPGIMYENSGFGGASTETQFVGENPNRNAKIIYYLKKRNTFGKMTMEVQNDEGKKIADLSPGKQKGLNIVTWNYLMKQPKTAKGKTLAFGGFTSPRVPAGTYTIVLTKGKESFTTELEVKNDPQSPITSAERKKHHEVTMELYNMSEELAYMVYELDLIVEKAEEIQATDNKAKKLTVPVIGKLSGLKKGLVVTTGDNYVGAAEPELRERLLALYAKIASDFSAPSANELANLRVIESEFTSAKEDYGKIKNKEVKRLLNYINKNDLDPPKIDVFEDYIGN